MNQKPSTIQDTLKHSDRLTHPCVRPRSDYHNQCEAFLDSLEEPEIQSECTEDVVEINQVDGIRKAIY